MAKKERPLDNRVWIELEVDSDHAVNEKRAAAASRMLKRLGVGFKKPVWWYKDKFCYCFQVDEAGGFVMASDKGHWFNLDYFGREED